MANVKQILLKRDFLLAADKARNNGNGRYTVEMIRALKEMARNGAYPDGRFSDEDCNVWSILSESN